MSSSAVLFCLFIYIRVFVSLPFILRVSFACVCVFIEKLKISVGFRFVFNNICSIEPKISFPNVIVIALTEHFQHYLHVYWSRHLYLYAYRTKMRIYSAEHSGHTNSCFLFYWERAHWLVVVFSWVFQYMFYISPRWCAHFNLFDCKYK